MTIYACTPSQPISDDEFRRNEDEDIEDTFMDRFFPRIPDQSENDSEERICG